MVSFEFRADGLGFRVHDVSSWVNLDPKEPTVLGFLCSEFFIEVLRR